MKMVVLALFSWTILSGCSTAGPPVEAPAAETARNEVIRITGTVVFVPVEGGFFGILAEDGRRYDPRDLPERMRRDGLKVKVEARPMTGAIGYHMWGTAIEIVHIEPRE